jgi:hypothetical protein
MNGLMRFQLGCGICWVWCCVRVFFLLLPNVLAKHTPRVVFWGGIDGKLGNILGPFSALLSSLEVFQCCIILVIPSIFSSIFC